MMEKRSLITMKSECLVYNAVDFFFLSESHRAFYFIVTYYGTCLHIRVLFLENYRNSVSVERSSLFCFHKAEIK